MRVRGLNVKSTIQFISTYSMSSNPNGDAAAAVVDPAAVRARSLALSHRQGFGLLCSRRPLRNRSVVGTAHNNSALIPIREDRLAIAAPSIGTCCDSSLLGRTFVSLVRNDSEDSLRVRCYGSPFRPPRGATGWLVGIGPQVARDAAEPGAGVPEYGICPRGHPPSA